MRMLLKAIPAMALGMILSMPAAFGVEPLVELEKVHKMAKEAVTASDHATVATHYRLHAEAQERKAVAYESEAIALEKERGPLPAMAHKWPSMVRKAGEKERSLAMQAKRTAKELLALSDKHMKLAIEQGFAEKAS
jgi:hypothetical protein